MPSRQPNLEVFAGSDHIVRRLRAAKRPEILMPLEIPTDELEIEPEMVEPGTEQTFDEVPIDDLPSLPLDDRPPPQPLRPAQLAAHEILPDEGEDE